MSRFFVVQLVAVSLVSVSAASPIVLETRHAHGRERNLRIRDAVTGSIWITPPHTNGFTATEAVDAYPGYRLPNRLEVAEMFAHFGLPEMGPDQRAIGITADQAQAFRELMSDSQNVVGTYLDLHSGLIGRAGMYGGDVQINDAEVALDVPIGFEGHWLVKPVPEPSSAWLLGMGCMGVMCCRRRSAADKYLGSSRRMPGWLQCWIVSQVILGGLSGILIGALIVKWHAGPGHPIYRGVQGVLRQLLGVG